MQISRSTRSVTQVFGAKDIIDEIEKLVGPVAKEAVKAAVREGANVIRREAVKRVPVRSGILKKSIVVKVAKTKHPQAKSPYLGIIQVARRAWANPNTTAGKLIGVDRRKKNAKGRMYGRRYGRGDIYPRNYAHLVHEGVRAHRQPNRGEGVMHPGHKGVPFLEDAMILGRERALGAIRARLLGEMFKRIVQRGRRAA